MARQRVFTPARRAAAWWALAVLSLLPLVGGCDARPPAPAVDPAAAVEAALARRVTLDVADEPLGDVLARLLEDVGAPLVNRSTRRWPATYHPHQRVALRLVDVRAESALRWLLWPRELDYKLGGGGVEVVGFDEPESLVLRVHGIADILDIDPRAFDEEALVEAVTSLISPESWDEVGGLGSIDTTPGALIVVQRPRVQRRIATLLDDIRHNSGRHEPRPPPAPPTAAEAAIDQALRRPVSLDLDRPLPPLSAWLRSVTDVNVVVDVGDDETHWTGTAGGRIDGVPLGDALDLLLPHGVTWTVRDEALSVEHSDDSAYDLAQSIVVYPLSGLLDERNAYGGAGEFQVDDLIDIVTSVVDPQAWDEVGGPGSICPVPGGLAVSQTRRTHAQVRELFDRLRAARDPYREEFDLPPPASEQEVLRALEQPVTIDWRDRTLDAGLRELLFEQCGLKNVLFDNSLDEDRTLTTWPVTFFARDIPLGEALRRIPQLTTGKYYSVDLGFSTEGGALQISTEEDLQLRCFRTAAMWDYSHSFVDLIQPISWDDVGGPGSLREFPRGVCVAQTSSVLAEMERLLAALYRIDDPAAGRELLLDDSPAARRVREALAAPVTLDVRAEPLVDFAAALARRHGLAVSLDRPGMEAAEIPIDVPLTGKYTDISLGAALKHLLGGAGLGWSERPGGLSITTRERLAHTFETRVYPFPEAGGDEWNPWEVGEAIVEMNAERWYDSATDATLESVDGGFVVLQTADGHAEIRRALDRLRRALLGEAAPPPAAETRIAGQLSQPALLDRAAMSREAALAQLAERHAVAIVVEPGVAERFRGRVGQLPDDATLAVALDRLFRPLGLTWAVRDEAIRVDDRRSALFADARTYDRRSLAALERALGEDIPIEGLLAYVARDCGSERPASAAIGPLFLVRESAAGHERLAAWLADASENVERLTALVAAVEPNRELYRDQAAAAPFREALLAGPPSLRVLATYLLCVRGSAVASEVIRGLPPDESALPALLALAAADQFSRVAEPAIAALEILGPRARAAAPQLAELISRSTNDRLDSLAFGALAEMGPAVLPEVCGLLELDYQTTVRVLAVLEGWGPAAAAAAPQLEEFLSTCEDRAIAVLVRRTLAAILPAGGEAAPPTDDLP